MILKIDPEKPEDSLIEKVISFMREGGVVVYPTETFYGLGADYENKHAIEKIFHLKGRTFSNPIALIGKGREDLFLITNQISESARKLIDVFWPGPLTLVFKALPSVSSLLHAGTGKIGIRVSPHPIAQKLTSNLGKPITATSANISGHKECRTAAEFIDQVGIRDDLMIIDGGPSPGGRGSTILDVSCEPPLLIREGAIPYEKIKSVIQT
ncbi:MAG: L-threonylcarbamoyladenylate synthase [Syntrophales bacterium]|nr:L-threonylcarbamoyladenylate synthase [Syntrophales bacterium]